MPKRALAPTREPVFTRIWEDGGFRTVEVAWNGEMVDEFGTKGGLLGWLPRGSTFYLIPYVRGSSSDPDDRAEWYRPSRGQALERARLGRLAELGLCGMSVTRTP